MKQWEWTEEADLKAIMELELLALDEWLDLGVQKKEEARRNKRPLLWETALLYQGKQAEKLILREIC